MYIFYLRSLPSSSPHLHPPGRRLLSHHSWGGDFSFKYSRPDCAQEEMMEASVHEHLLKNHGDELSTDGVNNQHGSLKPDEVSNDTNVKE